MKAPRDAWWSRLTPAERQAYERAARQAEIYGTRTSAYGLALSLVGSKRMREVER